MPNRISSLRAALLLLISSALITWPLSYWFPIGDFLGALNSSEYSKYSMTLKGIVALYFLFFAMNLISVGLAFTKLDGRVKSAVVLIPTVLLIVLPPVLVIPVSSQESKHGYFDILQALFGLLRFSTSGLWATVIVLTLLAAAINVFASILMLRDKAGEAENSVPKNIRNRYAIYAGVLALMLLITSIVGLQGSNKRALDRQACSNYAALSVPETDQGVPTFLSDIQLYGEAAGTKEVSDALVTFAQYSRQYYVLLDSENPGVDMDALAKAIAVAKAKITDVCLQYSVE